MRKALAALLVLLPTLAAAYSPIAHTNVVPYQCLDSTAYPSGFKFGVVAFSKPGIANVSFAIASGTATYSGTSPLTSSSMALNTRTANGSYTGSWEYSVTIDLADLSGPGTFTVTPTITDNNANTRVLSATTLYVVTTGTCGSGVTAWADSSTGNDGTCAANNEGLPCLTLGQALSVARTANSGSDDGNVIYLHDGSYTMPTSGISSTAQYVTIASDDSSSQAGAIITTGAQMQQSGAIVKFENLTLQSSGSSQKVVGAVSPAVWVDQCDVAGPAQFGYSQSSPLQGTNSPVYVTNTTVHEVDRPFGQTGGALLVRNVAIADIGDDAFQHNVFVLDSSVDNISNGWDAGGNPANHTDVYQCLNRATENHLVFGLKATDVRYEGFLCNPTTGQDLAFVNVHIELRDPPDKNETNTYVWASQFPGTIDHMLLINNTFQKGFVNFSGTYTNNLVVGNYFANAIDFGTPIGDLIPSWAEEDNVEGNTWEYNHYENVYGVTPECSSNDDYWALTGKACPHNYSFAAYSSALSTATTGNGEIITSIVDPQIGHPIDGGDIVGGLATAYISSDLDRVARGAAPQDIGAYELESDSTAPGVVADFAASSPTTTGFFAAFTSPGDDAGSPNVGVPASYDVRCCLTASCTTLEEAEWAAATQVTGEPSPSVAGTSESFLVAGLASGSENSSGGKASDESANEAALSNVETITTGIPTPGGTESIRWGTGVPVNLGAGAAVNYK